MSAKPEARNDAASPKKGKGKLIAIIVGAVLLLGGGGGAAWWFTRPKHDAADEASHAAKPPPDRVFTNLDPFTVNLADNGGERMAQIAIVVELESKATEERIAKNMPIVRNGILMLISSLESKEILSIAGKQRLAERIATVTGTAIGWEAEDEDAHDDEEEIEAPKASKGSKAKDGADDKASKKPRKRKPVRRAEPNPVVAVHFGQFIVQ